MLCAVCAQCCSDIVLGDVHWADIKENLPKFRRFTASQTRFCRRYLKGVLLRDYIVIEDDTDEDDDIQKMVERGAIRAMDLFVLASASTYFTPSYGRGDSVMYTVKSSLDATQTLRVYEDLQAEQSPAHQTADDLLILKMHTKASGGPGAMGHFKLAVLHVGSREIVFTYDGLVDGGCADVDHMAVEAYDSANKHKGFYVAEVRPVTPRMMAAHGVYCKEASFAKLAQCCKFKLPWTSFASLHRIPPMVEPTSFPSCSVDTCVIEDRCVEELTGHGVIELPMVMSFGRFELDRTVQSDRCCVCAVGCVYVVCVVWGVCMMCVGCAVLWALCGLCMGCVWAVCMLCVGCVVLCVMCSVDCALAVWAVWACVGCLWAVLCCV